VNVGLVVNSAFGEIQPYLSRDARTLFFGSNRPGSNNGDIWMATRTKAGHPEDDD